MNAKELAQKLNGRSDHNVITPELEQDAKFNNMVIIYGQSDDLIEFRGLIDDEAYVYEGKEGVIFDKEGLIQRPDSDEYYDCDEYERDFTAYLERKKKAISIDAIWCSNELNCSWSFKSNTPHETFNIYDDGELYCIGIVIDLSSN